MSEKQENNPTVVTTAAEELLSSGALNEAAAYFWRASEIYTAGQQWSEAADCLMRSAYCYELDGLKDQATRDYERAAELYTRARLAAEAAHAARMARNVCQVDDIDKHSSATHTIVIGAVGLNGSGKDILIMRLHDQFGIPMISIGDIVRDIAREEGVAATRDNLHEISERYIAKFGKEYFPQRVITKIEEQKWPIVGISGIRTPTDIRTFQKHYGKNFILIHVEVTDPRVRFERMQRRGEERDPQTYTDFLQHDQSEQVIFGLQESISMATMTIKNNGTLDEFYALVDQLATQLGIRSIHLSTTPCPNHC